MTRTQRNKKRIIKRSLKIVFDQAKILFIKNHTTIGFYWLSIKKQVCLVEVYRQ